MNHKNTQRTSTHKTDEPISWTHISMLNKMFKEIGVNVSIETEEDTMQDLGKTVLCQAVTVTVKPFGDSE